VRLTSLTDLVVIPLIICGMKENMVKVAAVAPIRVQTIYKSLPGLFEEKISFYYIINIANLKNFFNLTH